MSTLAPVRRQIVVNATPLRAFDAWTQQLAAWWPFATHSVYGEGSTATFVDWATHRNRTRRIDLLVGNRVDMATR